jgi:flavin-binding protein dodecin
MKDNMTELFYEARKYGQVSIFTSNRGDYSCNITFHTIKHVELTAHSGHGHETVENAIKSAINKAVEIVDSINSSPMPDTSSSRKLLNWFK